MDTESLWHVLADFQKIQPRPALEEEIEVDVAIIGGGITGLTTALHLIKEGKTVAILEAYTVGSGTTGNSTGNLYIETQPYFQNIVKKFDLETARIIAQSRKMAIDEIEQNVKERNIDCHFARRPWYIFTEQENQLPVLDEEVSTLKKMGFDIELTKDLPLSFYFHKAAVMQDQARLNPLNYVLGLAKSLEEQGCKIYENSRVMEFKEEKDRCSIKTAKGKVTAKDMIIATHAPVGSLHLQCYTAPYRSYVIAVKLQDGKCPEGHFWGMGEGQAISSTHAKRTNHPELLLVAGSHHKTGQDDNTEQNFKILEMYLRKQIPDFEIEYRWSAQHYQTADDVPYIGHKDKESKHTFIATGFFADGLIYGTIAGKVLSDLITKKSGQLTSVYNPTRSDFSKSIGFVTKENFNVFLEYLKDLPIFSRPEFGDVKPGEGKVVEINREKCGVSRDANNKLHVVSAVCTHMKGIVNWNNAEQTWDCPCHGSRFSQEGKVLEGPAITDLEQKPYNTKGN